MDRGSTTRRRIGYTRPVVQQLPTGYVLDLADPRAPTHEQWLLMSPAERERVVAMLPASLPLELVPEGDPHRKAKMSALETLDGFFQRAGRRIYLSSEIGVYYPGERRFAPDLLAVLDVEPHDRMTWVVDVEGKGLDFVLEVHVAGSWAKDHVANVERFARLGIHEYFVFDRKQLHLQGYRLLPRTRTYQRLLPQAGFFASEVLGLDLTVEGTKLRFFSGNAPIEDAGERIARLGSMVDEVLAHKEEALQRAEELEGKLVEEQRLRGEAERLRGEADHLREDAERRLAEALAEIERLKRS
jgi:Uma2 family endonuclease